MRLIYAEKLKAAIKNFVYLTEVSQHSDLVEGENIAFKKALELLDNAPTVEAEPVRHGHWKITDRDVMGCNEYTCSVCGHDTEGWKATHYCENCGAKMDEGVEE